MKKFTFTALMVITALTLGACGKAAETAPTPTQAPTQAPAAAATEAPAATATPVPTEAPVQQTADCTEILNQIFAAYNDENKLFLIGGSEDNANYEGPGAFTIGDGNVLDNISGYPVADVALIDSAATALHAMNANTFTSAAYHLTDASVAEDLGKRIAANIQNRMWMCGFPDKLVVIQIDDVVISAFGELEIMEYFKSTVTTVFPNAKVLVAEDIF